jgi:hypothetical protein
MIATTSKAKIYYLPAAELAMTPPPVSHWTSLRRRALRGWWHARLSLADIRLGLWRPRRRPRDDDYTALLRDVIDESPAQLIVRRPSRPAHVATVLDFEAARLRLRPVAP